MLYTNNDVIYHWYISYMNVVYLLHTLKHYLVSVIVYDIVSKYSKSILWSICRHRCKTHLEDV